MRPVETDEFFRFLFGDLKDGYLCIVTIGRSNKVSKSESKKDVKQHWFEWPTGLREAILLVEREKTQKDIYFSPFLYNRRTRKKEFVSEAPVAWADGDLCPIEHLEMEPSAVVRSSIDPINEVEKFHFYWKFSGIQTPDIGEDISKRIAYYHAKDGMDKSGWDLTQLLRVPDTYNHKYSPKSRVSKAILDESVIYEVEDFRSYPTLKDTRALPPITEAEIPDESGQEIILNYKSNINPRALDLFSVPPLKDSDWSGRLWELELVCLETGMSKEETFVVVRDSACNKYARDGRPQGDLWKEVVKASLFVKERSEAPVEADDPEAVSAVEPPPLLNEAQRDRVRQDITFIENYTKWAKGLGDAAAQYHPAGAFVILSSLLCGNVKLPTSFGTVVPNLWFMILADTTLTRKSTAMDIATDLLLEVDPDILLATDGSIEGLLTAMATRSGKSSLFLRDEVTGLIEAMAKKEYMAGMMETLTKMYDGKHMKRILRRETIDVQKPRLVLFAGGIKTKMLDLLTYQHVSSGFLPRFIFVTAESDLTRLKPIGPPTLKGREDRDNLLDTMQSIYAKYAVPAISAKGGVALVPKQWAVELTEEAWLLYNSFEMKLLDFALNSQDPTLLTPMMDRLSKSGLKAAVLIAASRLPEDNVSVTELDLLHAFYYIEQWAKHTALIISGVGSTRDEQKLRRIMQDIEKNPGILRSQIMQKHFLSARETQDIFTTLEQRNAIRREGRGARVERVYPVNT